MMRYETHNDVRFIIKLNYIARMYHNMMDSNPKYATTNWYSLTKTYKSVMNHIFMMNKIIKKQTYPFFAPPRSLRNTKAQNKKSKIIILSQFWDL